eukprot:gb/GFBE01059022.1/.p1 GENE.gb/GFBE01059022.1/~~gb/GFBE01059022.1/.p1  ORF type:complete len:1047 (+),score=261.67 gb/GFBE01059022.1/:1-3141(+)
MLRVLRVAAVLTLAAAEESAHESAEEVITDADAQSSENNASHDSCTHLEDIRVAFDALEKAMNPGSGQCGVAALKKADGWARPTAAEVTQPKCGAVMATNCSLSYHQVRCPEECPFLAPDQHFPCRFKCHLEDTCAYSNTNLPFADQKYKMCSKCKLIGCSWCKTPTLCGRCYPGFTLTEEGTCSFQITEGSWPDIVMIVLIVLVVLILITALVYCIFMPRSQYELHNFVAIASGRRHRHLAKVHQWDLGSKLAPRRWHSLTVDLSKENILGVGFGLYYNGICFLFVVTLITAIAMYLNYAWSAVSFVLASPDDMGNFVLAEGMKEKMTLPATITSPLESCWLRTPWVVADILVDFAEKRVWFCGILYAVLFVISLWFASHQKRWSDRFDAVNITMSDFCLLLTGLPCEETNEVHLKKWAQQELDKLKSTSDKLEVEGVSICYDYRDKQDDVNGMLERFCTKEEIDLGVKLVDDEAQDDAKELERLRSQLAEDREKALSWFEGANKLKSTGKAFLIFKSSESKELVLQELQKNPNLFKYGQTPIQVSTVQSEPPDVFWHNVGLSNAEVHSNERMAVIKVLVVFLVINIIFVFPFNRFVVLPYLAAGSSAGGPITMLNGIIMGIVNAQLGGQVWGAAFGVGYHRKDRADMFLFVMNTIITLCNTMTSLMMMAFTVYMADKESLISSQGRFLGSIADDAMIGEESDMVQNVFLMLVPGQLFVNSVNGLLMGNMLPFVQHSFVQKVMYIWKCLPDFLLQILKLILPWSPGIERYERFNAEMAFMAGQIGLPWDYSNLIVNPFVVFLTFFAVSPYCHRLCMYLFLWTIFYWFWCRFMHLRVQSVNYYSTNKLDWAVLLFWGLPLSVLAVTPVSWAIRSGQFLTEASQAVKLATLAGVFVLSNLLWVAGMLLVHPLRHENVLESKVCTFQETKNRWIFSWFNCNPVYVLKCLHHVTDTSGKCPTDWINPLACGEDPSTVRYFRIGKENLHFSKEKQPIIEEGLHDWLEFETYLEILLGIADLCKRNRSALYKGDVGRAYTKVATVEDPALS